MDPNTSVVSPEVQPVLIQTLQTWEVISPTPKHTLKGSVTPGFLKRSGRSRRINIEIHQVPVPITSENDDPKTVEKVYICLFKPSRFRRNAHVGQADFVDDSDRSIDSSVGPYHNIPSKKNINKNELSPVSEAEVCFDDDDISLMSYQEGTLTSKASHREMSILNSFNSQRFHGWELKHKFELQYVKIARYHSSRSTAMLMVEVEGIVQERKIIFSTDEELSEFLRYVQEQKLREEERSKERLRIATDGLNIDNWGEFAKKTIDILVEIVGAQNLIAADSSGTSDPFVKVKLNGKTIHQTKVIKRSLDPIWNLSTKSFFILSTNARELFQNSDGLTFLVYDSDVLSDNDILGAVTLSPKELYIGNEERNLYDLHPYVTGKKKEGFKKGTLAIRTRHASDYDKKFMKRFIQNETKKKNPVTHSNYLDHRGKDGHGIIATITQKRKRVVKIGNKEVKQFKIRPLPVPSQVKEWMSTEEIDKEVMKPSEKWKHAGNGTLGRIFLEVIGCYGLPNLDNMRFLGNKTDAFVKVVYEDVAVQTDTIDDCLSPRWFPWMQRAFTLYTMHPSSQLFVGIFDYDSGSLNSHDLIGKVTVDLTHLRPGTEYTLDYDILTTTLVPGEKRGTIKLRIRKEIFDVRSYMLKSIALPPSVHVNVDDEKEWFCVRGTCQGKYNMTPYNLETIYAYIEELLEYTSVVYYLKEASVDLILWRSSQFSVHVRLPWLAKTEASTQNLIEKYTKKVLLKFPIHSLFAFLTLTTLIEKPRLFPSFIFALWGWILMAVMSWKLRHPDPWKKCNTFREYLVMLLTGETLPPHSIEQNENSNDANEYEMKWKEYLDRAKKRAEVAALRAEKEAEEYAKEMEEITAIDSGTKTKDGKGLVAKILEPYLYPIQVYLGQICEALRFAKNVVLWEECYYSFWFATAFFILAILFYYVPWLALVQWTLRSIVWICFGPWMKLVDVFYVSKLPLENADESIEDEDEKHKQLMNDTRIKKEDVLKLADMKRYLFGQYHVKVFILKMERFIQKPLPSSSAIPFSKEKLSLEQLNREENVKKEDCKQGQQLVGIMLPKIQEVPVDQAPTGKQIGEQQLLGQDQDINIPLLKFSFVVLSAVCVTWIGLPPIISTVKNSFFILT